MVGLRWNYIVENSAMICSLSVSRRHAFDLEIRHILSSLKQSDLQQEPASSLRIYFTQVPRLVLPTVEARMSTLPTELSHRFRRRFPTVVVPASNWTGSSLDGLSASSLAIMRAISHIPPLSRPP